MNRIAIFIPLLALSVLVAAVYETTPPKKKRFQFVGIEKCNTCHATDAIGNQYARWLRTPHANAMTTLKSETARAIAARNNVANPLEDRACLRCHTTGGGKSALTKSEGVGCEACHGPGSGYHEYENHVDTINRKVAYDKAQKYGMYPVLGIKNIKKREKLCLRCHSNTRPCVPADQADVNRQNHSLQVISELRKGTMVIKHPLVPPFPQY